MADIEEAIRSRLSALRIQRIVLFGSLATGEGDSGSDIDLFVEIRNERDRKRVVSALEKLAHHCLDTYGNRLSPYVLTTQQARNRRRAGILRSVAKGRQVFPPPAGRKFARDRSQD